MTCPSHIYSKICEGEPNGLGSTKKVIKRIKNERLGDKVQEREAIFRRVNQNGYMYWFCAGYDFSYTV